MSIELDPQEVLEHLYSLGYCNITKEQLKDFIKDLKKLIKYDIRKEERKYRLARHHEKYNKENEYECSPSTPTKHKPTSEQISKSPLGNSKLKGVPDNNNCCINSPIKSDHCNGNQIVASHSRPSTSNGLSSACPNCHHCLENDDDDNVQNVEDEPDDSTIICKCAHVKKSGERKQKGSALSNKKSATSAKPCPSFIRPDSSKVKPPPKADPVALYHYYKMLWSQHNLPGENSHEDLRWRIRHKMMAPPVLTRTQNEDKLTKKPDWVAS